MTKLTVLFALLAAAGDAIAQPGMPPVSPPPLPAGSGAAPSGSDQPLPEPPDVTNTSAMQLIEGAEGKPVAAISFDQAVSLALAHSADARIAADEVARASALLDESRAQLLPMLGISAQYQQLEGDRFSRGTETSAAESFIGELNVSFSLLDLRKHANVHRVRDALDVERTTAANTRRTVAVATGRAYLSVFAAARIIEVAELAAQTAKAHVDYATHRTQGGIGTDLDIVRAQSELATDEQDLANARNALVQAEEALGVLVGQNAPLGAAMEPVFPDAPDISTVEDRADIVNGKRALSAAQWSRDAQWTEYTPSLSLSGEGFYDTPQIDPTPAWGFQVLAVLSLPLYDGGYRYGLRRERDALLAESREQLAQLERNAGAEVRAAIDAVAHARDARDAAHRSADFATKALQLANIAYQGGTGTSLDVIDAERTARDAATQAVIADDGLRQAEFSLLAATGHFPK